MSSQSEPPPLNVDAVRAARGWLESGDDIEEGPEHMRALLDAYENLAARFGYVAAVAAEMREEKAKRQASPAHPNTMIEGGGQTS